MKKNSLRNRVIISAIALAIAILVFNKDEIYKAFNEESITESATDSKLADISKIEELQKIKLEADKEQKDIFYDEVISILGEGTVVYPSENDKASKVVYWEFQQDGYRYFLDIIFFNDQLVDMQSRLVQFPASFKKSNIEDFRELEDEISKVSKLSELEDIVGEGVKAIIYYAEKNQAIYSWSYEGGFLVVYTSDDEIIYSKTTKTLDELVAGYAKCH